MSVRARPIVAHWHDSAERNRARVIRLRPKTAENWPFSANRAEQSVPGWRGSEMGAGRSPGLLREWSPGAVRTAHAERLAVVVVITTMSSLLLGGHRETSSAGNYSRNGRRRRSDTLRAMRRPSWAVMRSGSVCEQRALRARMDMTD